MRYEFHPKARAEFYEAIGYYNSRRPDLGNCLVLEIERVIERILESPNRQERVDQQGPLRRCLAHTFPYGVLYTIEPEYVLIVAVMHHSREPDYWRNRMQ